jgi:hypothetical protein
MPGSSSRASSRASRQTQNRERIWNKPFAAPVEMTARTFSCDAGKFLTNLRLKWIAPKCFKDKEGKHETFNWIVGPDRRASGSSRE